MTPRPGPGPGAGAGAGGPEYPQSAYNYGTWTAADDRTLLSARARGQHWADLQRAHFPSKTANACRKRYERLMERRGVYDYDARKLERIAKEYMTMRRQIWSGLAARVGEKWHVVEAQCMSAGLRTIQSNARSHTNRWRRETRMSQKSRLETEGVPPGLTSPVEDEFSAGFTEPPDPTTTPTAHEHGHGHGHGNMPGARSSAEIMPPPFLPSSGPPLASPLHPAPPGVPPVPFGGYLNGKSTKASGGGRGLGGAAGQPDTANLGPGPGPGLLEESWQNANLRGGYVNQSGHQQQHYGWGDDDGSDTLDEGSGR
ncbi:hypothetical protein B0T25DRAFT_499625 [Lasiosphaeria hispida]|uniref:Myb-like domain-containing protein n=2 Tax=Lasiosphaeriaceae TaxID=42302 RepID=A0AAJ0HNQ3_9PEZI|nr:hypothetical protein B0T25DRAFT_499625 [Lasiosphaeria hispida]